MNAAPRIGQLWPEQGGLYAGVIRGVDGGLDQHLVLSLARPSGRLNWKASLAWAAGLDDAGFKDWSVPTRAESRVLMGNVPEAFEPYWHWTSEQYSAGYAWTQSFDGGTQLNIDKSYEGRCRAVRRFALQSFGPSEGAAVAPATAEAAA